VTVSQFHGCDSTVTQHQCKPKFGHACVHSSLLVRATNQPTPLSTGAMGRGRGVRGGGRCRGVDRGGRGRTEGQHPLDFLSCCHCGRVTKDSRQVHTRHNELAPRWRICTSCCHLATGVKRHATVTLSLTTDSCFGPPKNFSSARKECCDLTVSPKRTA
jgi:hypothetical protein